MDDREYSACFGLGKDEDPHAIEAEHALLGMLLYDGEAALKRISCGIDADHFIEEVHGEIWSLAKSMIEAGRTVDAVIIARILSNSKPLNDLGGATYLADLFERAPPTRGADDYAQAIIDAAQRRALLEVARVASVSARKDLAKPAYEIASDVRKMVEEIEQATVDPVSTSFNGDELAATVIAKAEANEGKPRGLMCGLQCVDRRLGGLLPGKVIIIGARPSMGKTALARNIMSGAADRYPDLLFPIFGIEMGPEEMMQRELSARSFLLDPDEAVPYIDLATGAANRASIYALKRVRVPRNLIFDDCSKLTLEGVQRKVWSLARKGRIGALAIDYLQLMSKPDAGRSGRNDAALWGDLTSGLKQIARAGGFPILLLSQLSRKVEERDDKRPILADLRESGSIEQDADAVLFPFRQFYYDEREQKRQRGRKAEEFDAAYAENRTLMEVICAKQRQGPVGVDRQHCNLEYDLVRDQVK